MKSKKRKIINLSIINKYLRKAYLIVGAISATWIGLLMLRIPLGISLGLPRHLYLGIWMYIGLIFMLIKAILTVVVIIESKRKCKQV